jgi:SPP1 family predicted phage head-tail adaptor
MGIGRRFQVQLIPMVSTQSANGVWQTTEGLKYGAWAEITDPTSGNTYSAWQVQMDNTRVFLIRFRFDKFPNADWKIRYDGKDWTVTGIRKVDEKQFYWRLTATAKHDV